MADFLASGAILTPETVTENSSDSSGETECLKKNFEFDSLYSNFVRSNDVVTAVAGTSINKSSQNALSETKKSLSKLGYSIESEELGADTNHDDLKHRRASRAAPKDVDYSLAQLNDQHSSSGNPKDESGYHFNLTSYGYSDEFDENLLETLTIIAEEESPDPERLNELLLLHQNKLKPTVMTILLTHKWRQEHRVLTARKKKGKKKVQIRYLNTFRMEPKMNLNKDEAIRFSIICKVKQTFRSLVEKHGKYDIEYTPRFLKIITEMIKNDVKSFKLERYKIVCFISILQKRANTEAVFESKELFDMDNDYRISLKEEANTFYAICLIFFVFKE
jgi:hypothetical protein